MKKTIISATVILMATLYACKPEPLVKVGEIPNTNPDVFVICEGYNDDTSEILGYNSDSNKTYRNLFFAKNNRRTGKFTQSMYISDNKGYIVINGNKKVEIMNMGDYKSLGTITGFTSPRYFLKVNNSTAYVSDWYEESSVCVVNLNNNTIKDRIFIYGKGTEQMVMSNGKVFACNLGLYNLSNFTFESDSTVSVIDVATNSYENKINIGAKQVSDAVLADDGNIWVLANGYTDYNDMTKDTKGKLVKINTKTFKIIESIVIGEIGEHPTKLSIASNGDIFFQIANYYAQTGRVVRYKNGTFTTIVDRAFYGLGYGNGYVYGTDAGNYQSDGYMLKYNINGGRVGDTIRVGVNPGNFAFAK